MYKQPTQEDMTTLIRNRCWAIALTSGSITATVSYWISQLPAAQRQMVIDAINAFFTSPIK